MLVGCLFPAPLAPRTEENRPVYLDFKLVTPETTRSVPLPRGAEPVEFHVPQVEDPDLDDYLYARWYLDYTRLRRMSEQGLRVAPTGQAIRQTPWSVALNPCDSHRSELTGRELALLECVVSDRPILTSEDQPEREPDPEGSWVQVTWLLEVTGECP